MEKLICITGTNASGKSGLGIELALKLGGCEIISADSRQIFTGLDLGSGKVTREEMKGVPHHMIDVAMPNDFFSLSDYQAGAYRAIDETLSRGHQPLLVGGTGLYINAVVDGYSLSEAKPDPELRRSIEEKSIDELIELIRGYDPSVLDRVANDNKRRLERAAEKLIAGVPLQNPSIPRYEVLELGVTWPREILYQRIEERLDRRLEQGMIKEVEDLKKNGASEDFLYKLGLEYRYIQWYLMGHFASFDEFREELFKEIRHLAKEQMTWFRKRKNIKWIDMQGDPEEEALEYINTFLNN